MPQEPNRILSKMLERLFSALINGPSLNCKPHSSRQRVDFNQLAKLRDIKPEEVLRQLLSNERTAKVFARVPAPPKRLEQVDEEDSPKLSDADRAARQAWSEQQSLLSKTRTITEDARNYENDTGVHILHIGFPLLSLPPGSTGLQRSLTRRILAPLAFISVSVTLKGGATPSIVLECKGEGVDLVVPNSALLSWVERQTGQAQAELFEDETGEKPWEELTAIVQRVCKLLEMPPPPFFASPACNVETLELQSAPRSDAENPKPSIVQAAVLGLFPMANQGLLRDMQAMVGGELATGPIQSFLEMDAGLMQETHAPEPAAEEPVQKRTRVFAEERLVTSADPCQSRAVRLAKTSRGLVIHGPPGTGKSQTITNVIGDHLARGQRILMVCDKRTALDVVYNRLESMGLGQFCAVVHDPQRDQRDLYRSIREQLDALADTQSNSSAARQLAKVDEELQNLHQQMTDYHAALMNRKDAASTSFHDLAGRWLSLPSIPVNFKESSLQGVDVEKLESHSRELGEILDRAVTVGYPENPWTTAAGASLGDFLAMPMDQVRERVATCVEKSASADATIDPSIPPFSAGVDWEQQGQARNEIAESLAPLLERLDQAIAVRWAKSELRVLKQDRQKLTDAAVFLETLRSGPLDGELATAVRASPPSLSVIGLQTASIDEYLAIASKWYSFCCFKRKSAAQKVASAYGVALTPDSAKRLKTFFTGLRARLILQALHADLLRLSPPPGWVSDDILDSWIGDSTAFIELYLKVHERPELNSLVQSIATVLVDRQSGPALINGLRLSPARATAVTQLLGALKDAELFGSQWIASLDEALRQGKPLVETLQYMNDRLDTLEGVLRVREGLAGLSTTLASATKSLIDQRVEGEAGLVVMKKAALALEIIARLKTDPVLQNVDGQRMKTTFERYRQLDQQKKALVRETVVHHWVTQQKSRLLASTGSRLNGSGADLRRRLTIRGAGAMRLRQVIHNGQEIEGGDPLFDLRPVWMASPETVAQVFPRKALFDVVIFDEASQCRLEEALPVLLRAHRVVIAGDPKQLPPTRFFESALVSSEEAEIETDQELFEAQQSEIEDLLGAALNIEIQECYLDVHYRSRNSDLIQFSNQHFYSSRLQPIPGHPSNRTRYAPLTLNKVNGVYDKRCNVAEAERVCHIVQDLLKRATPPSIGIACFNLQQRDTIVEKLEALAMEDAEFGRRLAEARNRRGPASFEGLFVKNLENVQGDERDHIIISTTYGPDPKGRFYRRFGPLGQAGGGRRLNVLVTRAREEVHLVTSIPESAYRALPPVPAGENPSGAWLLFSYLSYAEQLAEQYETAHQSLAQAQEENRGTPQAHVRVSRWPSVFSQSLAHQLVHKHSTGSDVHWGNDGFCVDLALHHPHRAEDVTIGVMCDLTRFGLAEDPMEWEVFRTWILEGQGWQLHRLWTPHFFRDRHGCLEAIVNQASELLANE